MRMFTGMIALLGMLVYMINIPSIIGRKIGWWWEAPTSSSDPSIEALLNFSRHHANIMSTVLMRCGVTTTNGTISGTLLPACETVMPILSGFGIQTELWLGQTDTVDAAVKLWSDPQRAIETLAELGSNHSEIVGFNFDFEIPSTVMCGTKRCDQAYADFLSQVRDGLLGQWRVTADVDCADSHGGFAPVINNCSLLARATDKIINMNTYNSGSYERWLQQLAPALNSDIPREKLGFGLACYVDDATNNTWSVTEQSAKERICVAMNHSVNEIDMFRVAPELGWPEEFWLPYLESFVSGAGCIPPAPQKSNCPPFAGWLLGESQGYQTCCVLKSMNVDMSHCPDTNSTSSHEACAKAQCQASNTSIHQWTPLNYSHFPYTCCPA